MARAIQHSVAETLLAAKTHPDQYRDLVVRVAGYSAFFTALSPEAQDDIIKPHLSTNIVTSNDEVALW